MSQLIFEIIVRPLLVKFYLDSGQTPYYHRPSIETGGSAQKIIIIQNYYLRV